MLIALALAFIVGTFWVGAVVLGAAVAWRGLRGTRVDDVLRCARCRYNLSGGPTRPDRCPECGSNLLMPDSVRVGRRRARPRLIVTGVAICLAACIPALVPALSAAMRAMRPAAGIGAVTRAQPAPRTTTANDPMQWVRDPALARATAEIKMWRRNGALETGDSPLQPQAALALADLGGGPGSRWPWAGSPSAESQLWASLALGDRGVGRTIVSIIHPDGTDDLRAGGRGPAAWGRAAAVVHPAAADLGWTAHPRSPAEIAAGNPDAVFEQPVAPAKRRSRIGF